MAARFPLFKGATRVPTVAGVPLIPAVAFIIAVASASVLLGLSWLVILVPGWLLMTQITRTDDRAFRVLWLWAQTKLANRVRLAARCGARDLWGASTYATFDRRFRSWEGRGSRWAG